MVEIETNPATPDESSDPTDPTDPQRITAHGQAFITFIYGLFRHQTFAVPPGATADGLAAAFEREEFSSLLSNVLSTLALERLIRSSPPVPPEVILPDGREVRVALWDAELEPLIVGGIHQRVVGLLAQLFLVGSAVQARDETVLIDDSRDGGRELTQLGKLMEAEAARSKRRARGSNLAWPEALARNDSSPVTLASVPPERLAPREDPIGPLDLVLLESAIRAGRDICPRIASRLEELATRWKTVLDRAVDASPLTFILAEDPQAVPPPGEDSRRGVDGCAHVMAPLFEAGNHYLLRYFESVIVDSWIETEQRRLRHDDTEWSGLAEHFIDIADAVRELAIDSDHASILTMLPRYYDRYFRAFPGEGWSDRVRARMTQSGRRRFSDRQLFADSELAIFGPLDRFATHVDELRRRNFAERSAEETFLVNHPLSRVDRLQTNVRFCREKIALPFASARS